ncbi:MAG: hypothetical protein JNM42_13635 [Propionivibrio sp.]|uniref:hypothetical protein n=1 Tax=Propionivibrio sp. TaxID=2212460 RepID=UPI001A4B5CAE|nr:hypothetical protein [Propionivibrio sp.]MBL8415474.1 hypothetical protein [Propionivibrio sp.]
MKSSDAAPSVADILKIDNDMITIRLSPTEHPDIRLNMRPLIMVCTVRGKTLLYKGRFAA